MTFNEEHALETYKSLVGISTEALKALQLLNGGAIVAVLAYLGQLKAPATAAAGIQFPLWAFITGLTLGTIAFIGSYFTQLALYNETVRGVAAVKIKHEVWLWCTVILALASVGAFAWGAPACAAALTSVGP